MEDFLYFDDIFTPEQRLIRDTVAQFVDDKVLPDIADCFESGEFNQKWIKDVADMGLLGLTLPEEYGGCNASYMTYGLVCQELERGDSGLRSFVSVQSSLCMYPIYRYGSEEQKKRFLPKMASGEYIGAFGLTEPDSGSDPAGLKTTAKKVDGGWQLNGSKMWITNATIASIAIVWAKTSDGIRGFIVEKDFPGFETNEIKQKMSLRASITGELVFNDVFVPDENYLPLTSKGLSTALSCLTQARFGIAWGVMGAAMACFDIAQEYVKTRKQFGKSLASYQLIQSSLSEMFSEIVRMQCFNLRLSELKDNQKATPVMVSCAKRAACRSALKIAREARNLLGANGVSLQYHVIRHMLNLESVFTYEGTDNVHTLILGQHLTGINAFGD